MSQFVCLYASCLREFEGRQGLPELANLRRVIRSDAASPLAAFRHQRLLMLLVQGRSLIRGRDGCCDLLLLRD